MTNIRHYVRRQMAHKGIVAQLDVQLIHGGRPRHGRREARLLEAVEQQGAVEVHLAGRRPDDEVEGRKGGIQRVSRLAREVQPERLGLRDLVHSELGEGDDERDPVHVSHILGRKARAHNGIVA